jgi:hypothetical protein
MKNIELEVRYLEITRKAKMLKTPKFRKRNLSKAYKLANKLMIEDDFNPIVSLEFPIHKNFLH